MEEVLPESEAVYAVPPTLVKYCTTCQKQFTVTHFPMLTRAPLFSDTTVKWALSAFMRMELSEPSYDACQMVPPS